MTQLTKVLKQLLWIAIHMGNFYFLYNVIIKIWISHQTKPLSFTVDTNYLNWTTNFPAISICEVFNAEKMWDLNEEIYGQDRNKYFDDIMTDVTFFSGTCYSCKKCAHEEEYCAKLSLEKIAKSFRTPCQQLLGECRWNGEPFECCEDGFVELQSEFGTCYTINSMHTRPQFGKKLFSDRTTGPGTLELAALEDVELFLHSTEDVPSKSSDRNQHETVSWGSSKEIMFDVQEIINEPEVERMTFANRRCRFNWELDQGAAHKLFDYHSYSACMVQCNFRVQLELCGCVHHLMPVSSENVTICGFKGLICLTDNYEEISRRRRYECSNCLISCTEQEIRIVYSSNDQYFNQFGTRITISLLSLPKVRYIRKTVRSYLAFVICLGGIFGLLYGASILTLIEFIFKLYRRLSRSWSPNLNWKD